MARPHPPRRRAPLFGAAKLAGLAKSLGQSARILRAEVKEPAAEHHAEAGASCESDHGSAADSEAAPAASPIYLVQKPGEQ
ncbi:twin-arginine translocase TatA/TatE family subunit [Herbiconiux liukaitaii]|uniref:twin-arginine translocase TatA/TatE family subunit n=1 Tax=Herbiconiux liukaitaii TaxID=3342799 RepID=UPI0035B8D332